MFCNSCGGTLGSCGHCGQCQPKCGCENKCQKPCGCPEAILSIESDSSNPALLRFNLGGRSVWFDFTGVVRAAESCTSIKPNAVARNIVHDGECHRDVITASELGSVLHLADIGDVDANSLKDNSLLVFQQESKCSENCEGTGGWKGVDPSEVGKESLSYIMGSDADGVIGTLEPPANSSKFNYLTWAAQGKAKWSQMKILPNAPTDKNNRVLRPYVDPDTLEIVAVWEDR